MKRALTADTAASDPSLSPVRCNTRRAQPPPVATRRRAALYRRYASMSTPETTSPQTPPHRRYTCTRTIGTRSTPAYSPKGQKATQPGHVAPPLEQPMRSIIAASSRGSPRTAPPRRGDRRPADPDTAHLGRGDVRVRVLDRDRKPLVLERQPAAAVDRRHAGLPRRERVTPAAKAGHPQAERTASSITRWVSPIAGRSGNVNSTVRASTSRE